MDQKRLQEIVDITIAKIIPAEETKFISFLKNYVFDTKSLIAIENTFDLMVLTNVYITKIAENPHAADESFSQPPYLNWFGYMNYLIPFQMLKDEIKTEEDRVRILDNILKIAPEIKLLMPIASPFITEITEYLQTMKVEEQENFYYWPYPREKLDLLYNLLLSEKMVGETVDFSQPFLTFEEHGKSKNQWLSSQPSLYVLLYFIYGKEEIYLKEPISIIAMKLFRFNQLKSNTDSIKESFRKTSLRLQAEAYLQKKHKNLLRILDKLQL